jgi:hypothetical protein
MARSNVAVKEEANLPVSADLDDFLEQHSGVGTSQRAEDNLVPMISVLQAQSPAADRRNQAYIQGAEPGAFRLKNSPVAIVPGDGEGLLFIPAHFAVYFVEWTPREKGGGFVRRHDALPKEARKVEDERGIRFVMPNGNEVQETRYHTGLVPFPDRGPMPFVLPFKGSGHTTSRNWQTLMNGVRTKSGKVAPSFARIYRLTTKQRTNTKGTWFAVEVEEVKGPDGRPVVPDLDLIKMAAALSAQITAGEKQLADEEQADAPAPRDLDNEAM